MAIKSKKVHRTAREKVKTRIRKKISLVVDRPRISIFRSSKHSYAQLISDAEQKTLVSASTLDTEVQELLKTLQPAEGEKAPKVSRSTKSRLASRAVGIVLAKRAIAAKIEAVVFDRNGFVYSGRVQALADGAREGGLKF